jgi:hypothetical protein
MEKQPDINFFRNKIEDSDPEELLNYVENIEDPEEIRKVIGEQGFEKLSDYLKRKKIEEKFSEEPKKNPWENATEKEILEARREDREENLKNYPRK